MVNERVTFGDGMPFEELLPVADMPPRLSQEVGLVALNPDVMIRIMGCVPLMGETVTGELHAYSSYLNHLDQEYSIPNALLGFVVGSTSNKRFSNGGRAPYAVVNYIKDAVSFNKITEEPISDQDVITEFDLLGTKMLRSIGDAYISGGVYEFEVTSLGQCVYSASAAKGVKAIFVDVEPWSLNKFEDLPENEKQSKFLETISYLVGDLIKLQSQTKTPVHALQLASQLLADVFGSTDRHKQLSAKKIIEILNEAEESDGISDICVAEIMLYCIDTVDETVYEKLQNEISQR